MALTSEQKQSIREEEFFRAEVRQEMAQHSGPPSLFARVSAFFDTKAGFWLLTTALAGLVATGMTSLQRYLDRDEIASRARAERRLRDTDTLLKLEPILTSGNPPRVNVALVLLDGLASDAAVDRQVSDQVKALVAATLNAGLKPGATPEQRVQAEAILSYVDKASTDSGAPKSPVAVAVDTPTLPIRVYIQTADKPDPRAESAKQALEKAGLIVPGIETVGRTAARHSVRYCGDKVADDAVERVKTALQPTGIAASFDVLDPKLCGRVRFNHFELWLARGG